MYNWASKLGMDGSPSWLTPNIGSTEKCTLRNSIKVRRALVGWTVPKNATWSSMGCPASACSCNCSKGQQSCFAMEQMASWFHPSAGSSIPVWSWGRMQWPCPDSLAFPGQIWAGPFLSGPKRGRSQQGQPHITQMWAWEDVAWCHHTCSTLPSEILTFFYLVTVRSAQCYVVIIVHKLDSWKIQ